MDATGSVKPFVSTLLASAPLDVQGRDVGYWELDDDAEVAEARLQRVLAGHQRATTTLAWILEAEGERPPGRGDLRVLRDAAGRPQAVIEVLESQVVPFEHVDEHVAADVGEGDLSLRYWRSAYGAAFERQCRRRGWRASEAMPIVCLRFRLVYPRLMGA